jgi:hypothetical protein
MNQALVRAQQLWKLKLWMYILEKFYKQHGMVPKELHVHPYLFSNKYDCGLWCIALKQG